MDAGTIVVGVISGLTSAGIVAGLLLFILKGFRTDIRDNRKSINSKTGTLHRKINGLEDCMETEVKDVKSQTNAILHYLLATTDREQHPEAVKILEDARRPGS